MNDDPRGTDADALPDELPLPGLLIYVRGDGPGRPLSSLHGDAEGTVGHTLEALRADPYLLERRVHPDDRSTLHEAVEELAPGEDATVDYRVRVGGGEVRWVRDTVRRSLDNPDRLVGVLRSVSAERVLREQVDALERRIWRSQRMDSLGSLAAGVAHDFNNLLTTILSSVQLLEEGDLGGEARSDLALIRQSADRGARMVRQILRFARRGDAFVAGPVEVGTTVENLRPILERTLGVACELRIRVAPDLPSVRCDTAQLEQIFLNLVVNARDAMPQGGHVRIVVTTTDLDDDREVEGGAIPPGRYVVARVEDDGPGIPDEVRERIFEPFFTTKSGDARSGSGFGLSTVQRIVRGYGGGITVKTARGRGTTFGIWLPVDPGEEQAGALPFPGSVVEGEAGGPRILVAEGDPETREAVARLLSRDGHPVVSVGSAVEAIRAFDRTVARPALLYVSAVLPDRYGRELVTALRRREPGLPVVIASSRGSLVRDAGDEGLVRSPRTVRLARPFTPAQLRAAVARALEGRDEDGGEAWHPSVVS